MKIFLCFDVMVVCFLMVEGKGTPVFMMPKIGEKIILKCKIKKQPHEKHSSAVFIDWEFLACGTGLNQIRCQNVQDTSEFETKWITKISKTTNPIYQIDHVSEEDSGLYRCTSRDSFKSTTSTVVKLYELDVITANHSPEFMETTSHLHTFEGFNIVLRCSVYSVLSLQISWLREVTELYYTESQQIIPYSNKTFIRLPAPAAVEISENIYLSKLQVPKVQVSDQGLYICLAINNKDMKYREIEVSVTKTPSGFEPHTSFSLLFLIPVCLAIIPVVIWFWFIYWRRGTIWKKEVRDDCNYQHVLRIQ